MGGNGRDCVAGGCSRPRPEAPACGLTATNIMDGCSMLADSPSRASKSATVRARRMGCWEWWSCGAVARAGGVRDRSGLPVGALGAAAAGREAGVAGLGAGVAGRGRGLPARGAEPLATLGGGPCGGTGCRKGPRNGGAAPGASGRWMDPRKGGGPRGGVGCRLARGRGVAACSLAGGPLAAELFGGVLGAGTSGRGLGGGARRGRAFGGSPAPAAGSAVGAIRSNMAKSRETAEARGVA